MAVSSTFNGRQQNGRNIKRASKGSWTFLSSYTDYCFRSKYEWKRLVQVKYEQFSYWIQIDEYLWRRFSYLNYKQGDLVAECLRLFHASNCGNAHVPQPHATSGSWIQKCWLYKDYVRRLLNRTWKIVCAAFNKILDLKWTSYSCTFHSAHSFQKVTESLSNSTWRKTASLCWHTQPPWSGHEWRMHRKASNTFNFDFTNALHTDAVCDKDQGRRLLLRPSKNFYAGYAGAICSHSNERNECTNYFFGPKIRMSLLHSQSERRWSKSLLQQTAECQGDRYSARSRMLCNKCSCVSHYQNTANFFFLH